MTLSNCVKAIPGGPELVEAANEQREPLVRFAELVKAIYDNREQYCQQITEWIRQRIQNSKYCVLHFWTKAKEQISEAAKSVAKGAGASTVVGQIVEQVTCLQFEAVESAVQEVVQDPGGVIGGAIQEGIASAINPLDAIQTHFNRMKTSASGAWTDLTSGLKVGDAGKKLLDVFDAGLAIVDSLGLYIYLATIAIPGAIGTLIPAPVAGTAAGSGVGQIVNSVVGISLAVGQAIVNGVKIVAEATAVWTDISDKIQQVEAEARTAGQLGPDETIEKLQNRNAEGELPVVVFEEGEVERLSNLVTDVVAYVVFNGIGLAVSLIGTGARTIVRKLEEAAETLKEAVRKATRTKADARLSTVKKKYCRKRCFPAGTPIRVAEGTRPIETIRPGDLVWSCDPETEVWSLKEVVETYELDYVGDLATIGLDSGETLSATAGHPFWVEAGEALEDRPRIRELEGERRFDAAKFETEATVATATGRWVHAGDLLPGDVLVSLDFGRVVVASVAQSATRETTCNFHVADLHTYAVGPDGVLVHNNSESCDEETGDDKGEEPEDRTEPSDPYPDVGDLISPERRTHILDGDATGGGHRYGTGKPGKTEFPQSWSDNRILHSITDIATDPNATATQLTGPGMGTVYQGKDIPFNLKTKSGKPVRFKVSGQRDGVDMEVIYEPGGEGIVSGYPSWPNSSGDVIKNPDP